MWPFTTHCVQLSHTETETRYCVQQEGTKPKKGGQSTSKKGTTSGAGPTKQKETGKKAKKKADTKGKAPAQ